MTDAAVAERTIVFTSAVTRRLSDTDTPVSAYLKLCEGMPDSFLLESVEKGESGGRYSIVAFDPLITLTLSGKGVSLSGSASRGLPEPDRSPSAFFPVLRGLMAAVGCRDLPDLPCVGSLMGYVGWDCVRLIEELPGGLPDSPPTARLALSSCYVVFDHRQRIMTLVAIGGDRAGALERLERMEARLARPLCVGEIASTGPTGLTPPDRQAFLASVEEAGKLIRDGDIFQVVLSASFGGTTTMRPIDAYRRLRVFSPSPYMFFLEQGGRQLLGSSPETLVRVERSGEAVIRPIAGTRGRSSDPERDRSLEQELISSPKERAEHVMLVDLARNDIGKVCEFGSVAVSPYMAVERFSHVMHIVSEARGRLRPDADVIDAFIAGFPAGTVSGAPKLRAMQVIDGLEATPRGPYGGAVGYFGPGQLLDTCIAIRIIEFCGQRFSIRVGAGIVADSVGAHEYRELENKAAQSLNALSGTNGGLP
ncbi:anthranilate synthase component I family protein [Candidatus Fermentibacterales bacterium]|nr:anthranilate synthase component I family protein [Candidatus Fermentibacterales bacterium]